MTWFGLNMRSIFAKVRDAIKDDIEKSGGVTSKHLTPYDHYKVIVLCNV